jgi:hypothetical protein
MQYNKKQYTNHCKQKHKQQKTIPLVNRYNFDTRKLGGFSEKQLWISLLTGTLDRLIPVRRDLVRRI